MVVVDVMLGISNTPTRALWNFYKDIFLYIVAFTVLSKVVFGNFSAVLIFITISVFAGFMAFYLLKKQEFYFYYNLGYTRWKLFKGVFLINLVLGTPIVIITLVIVTMLFGDFKLIEI
jgi:hypothetical protein